MKTEIRELPGVTLWLARTGEVEPEEWPRLFEQMDPSRQERCRRYRREADQKRCILADALARLALSEGTALAPGALAFAQTPEGKPYAVGLDRHFSLSHSGELVLCAVADFPVGADVQLRRPVSQAMTRRMARAGSQGANAATRARATHKAVPLFFIAMVSPPPGKSFSQTIKSYFIMIVP